MAATDPLRNLIALKAPRIRAKPGRSTAMARLRPHSCKPSPRAACTTPWMLTGPKGVGKATLAWRLSRFLLATPDDDGGMFEPLRQKRLILRRKIPSPAACCALAEPRHFSLLRRGRMTRKPRFLRSSRSTKSAR